MALNTRESTRRLEAERIRHLALVESMRESAGFGQAGELMRLALEARGHTIDSIATFLGVTRSAVSGVVFDHYRSTRIETFIATVLGIPREALFCRTKPAKRVLTGDSFARRTPAVNVGVSESDGQPDGRTVRRRRAA